MLRHAEDRAIDPRAALERVWSEPVQAIAEQLGVANVTVAKRWAQADIPVPVQGYWSKIRSDDRLNQPGGTLTSRIIITPRPPPCKLVIRYGLGRRHPRT